MSHILDNQLELAAVILMGDGNLIIASRRAARKAYCSEIWLPNLRKIKREKQTQLNSVYSSVQRSRAKVQNLSLI